MFELGNNLIGIVGPLELCGYQYLRRVPIIQIAVNLLVNSFGSDTIKAINFENGEPQFQKKFTARASRANTRRGCLKRGLRPLDYQFIRSRCPRWTKNCRAFPSSRVSWCRSVFELLWSLHSLNSRPSTNAAIPLPADLLSSPRPSSSINSGDFCLPQQACTTSCPSDKARLSGWTDCWTPI